MSTHSAVTLLLTGLYLVVPGLLLALVVRLPVVLAIGSAPVLTFGLIAVLSRVSAATGIVWGPASFLVGAGFAVFLLAVLRIGVLRMGQRSRDGAWRLFRSSPEDVPPVDAPVGVAAWLTLGSMALAAVVGTVTAVWGMGGLQAVNQGFDALFHVNAVTLISETGNADPASVGAVNHFAYGSSYYPDAFHALAALVTNSGSSPVPATNALVASVPAVLAVGLAALLWQMRMPRHAVVVPLIAIAVAQFPFDLMWRGPIWPFALGVALVPAFVALLVRAFENRAPGSAALVALAAAGLLLVHPSAALAAGVFAAAFFVQRWVANRALLGPDVLRLAMLLVAAVVLALPAVVTAVANSGYGATYDWPAVQSPGAALGDLFLFNYDAPLPQVWLFVLLVAGLVGLRQLARMEWWLSTGAVFAVLLVLAASYEGRWVALLTGPWWNDRFRFAALATLGIIVLCSHGVVVIADRVTASVRRLAAVRRLRVALASRIHTTHRSPGDRFGRGACWRHSSS